MSNRIELCRQFATQNGWGYADWVMIAGDASNRKYYRLTDGTRHAVLMDAPPEKGEDVAPFIKIATFLRSAGLSAPDILAEDRDKGILVIEDLGDDLFASLLEQDCAQETELYQNAMDVLVHLHRQTPPSLERYDAERMAEMATLSLDWYVHRGNIRAERDPFKAAFFELFAQLDTVPDVLVQRDYHAQNLLWLPHRSGVARVGLLDFQDAMLGHPGYDVVSVLQDARRDVPRDIEDRMVRYFCSETNRHEDEFRAHYALLGLQRNLRILGVFARLSLRDGKTGYVDLIPRVWEFIERNLHHPVTGPVHDKIATLIPVPTPDILAQLR